MAYLEGMTDPLSRRPVPETDAGSFRVWEKDPQRVEQDIVAGLFLSRPASGRGRRRTCRETALTCALLLSSIRCVVVVLNV